MESGDCCDGCARMECEVEADCFLVLAKSSCNANVPVWVLRRCERYSIELGVGGRNGISRAHCDSTRDWQGVEVYGVPLTG